MKTLGCFLVLACTVLIPSSAQQAIDKDIKFDLDYLAKPFGTTLKSAEHVGVSPRGVVLKLTMEFTKDVSDRKALLKAFSSPVYNSAYAGETITWFYFFDAENVSLGKAYVQGIEGELTGKKGGRFPSTPEPRRTAADKKD